MKVVTMREDYFASNTYLVIDGGNAIIVDAGVSLATLKETIVKHDNPKIVGVLLTHSHYDHILSLMDYITEFECEAYIYNKGIENLADSYANYSAFTDKEFVIKSEIVVGIAEGDLSIGEFDVNVIYTPGHTDDCVCYVIDDVMFTGDTLFDGCIGRTDLVNSDELSMQRSLNKLATLPPYQMYFPGHGRKSDKQNMQAYLLELNS